MREAGEVAARLDVATLACAQAGVRFTELRRHVLGLVLAARRPVTAYALLEQLRGARWASAPATVYRTLDFLMQHGLIHRVERLNAFIGCDEGAAHAHTAQFLICRTCGAVDELDDPAVTAALKTAAAARGFAPGHAVVEVEGLCAACAP